MAERKVNTEEYTCGNCGKGWEEDDLQEIHDFWGRVSPGEIMPAGQCPECGALCHPTDREINIIVDLHLGRNEDNESIDCEVDESTVPAGINVTIERHYH